MFQYDESNSYRPDQGVTAEKRQKKTLKKDDIGGSLPLRLCEFLLS